MSFLSYRFPHRQKIRRHRDRRPIVFIDSRLSNCDTLIQQVTLKARAIAIGLYSDGIKDITNILNFSCCREVYLVGTGSPGCMYLGNSELSFNTLIQYQSELQSWFEPDLSDNFTSPKIFLYGCNIAAGDVGEESIAKLHAMTGAEIVASADISRHEIFN